MEREQGCSRAYTARAGNSRTQKYFSPRVAAAGSTSQSAGRNLLYDLGIGSSWLVVGSGLLLTSHWTRHRTLRGSRRRRPECACDRSPEIDIEENGYRCPQSYRLDSLRPCRHAW